MANGQTPKYPRRIAQAIVVITAPFPPPVHGAARVTEVVASALEAQTCEVMRVDLSAGMPSGRLFYHLRRSFRTLRALFVLMSQSFRGGRRHLYVTMDG